MFHLHHVKTMMDCVLFCPQEGIRVYVKIPKRKSSCSPASIPDMVAVFKKNKKQCRA